MGDSINVGSVWNPVHEVCLSDFYIGKHEVTQGEWEKVMGSNPSNKKKGLKYPVENVSWEDAQEFIRKLNGQMGNRYRLPTEAEWEYAARSGGKKEKWAGTSDESQIGAIAWYSDNSYPTHPVGEKAPNGLGIYDMTGNVLEWCSDWYGQNYYATSPKKDPQGPPSGRWHVLRGGSWSYAPGSIRAAYRVPSVQFYYDGPGFRVVSSPQD